MKQEPVKYHRESESGNRMLTVANSKGRLSSVPCFNQHGIYRTGQHRPDNRILFVIA